MTIPYPTPTTPLLHPPLVIMKLLFTIDTMKYFKQVGGAGSTHSAVSQSSQPNSQTSMNTTLAAPGVVLEAALPLVVSNGTQEEDKSGPKSRLSVGVLKKGASRIGKIVGRSRTSQLSNTDEDQPSPVGPDSCLGAEDEVFAPLKKLKETMHARRTSASNIEYLSYETAAHASPLSPRKPVIAHTDMEDGEYFAINRLNMDVHSQTLMVANCAGHVLVLGFQSCPFQRHGSKQVRGGREPAALLAGCMVLATNAA